MQDISDAELIERYSNGDTKAFEVLFYRYKEKCFRFILRFLGDYQEAEDVFQDVFLKIIQNIHNFRGEARFSTYLYITVRNICIDKLRKRNRVLEKECKDITEVFTKDTNPSPDKTVERKEIEDIVREALETLPIEQREVFVLKEETGLKISEIAEILKCSENTVKSRLRYAINHLREKLKVKLLG